jgi:HAD superfamily hydrolase (TIGR01509 family)
LEALPPNLIKQLTMLTAILFDLDGTLANTDPLHFKVWQEVLINYGLDIDEKFYNFRISGRLNPLIIKDLLPHLSDLENQQLADDKEAKFRELASELKPLAGLNQVLDWTEKCGLKRALVTNAPRKNVEFMLSVLNLTETFAPVVLAEEAAAPKPDPAPYKLALNLLDITPEQAVAFEDSPSGIRSAVGAGIVTIGIASTHESQTLQAAGALTVVPNFTAESLWNLLRGGRRV